MKFINQFKSTVYGTVGESIVSDAFFSEGKIYVFDKYSYGTFELRVIENNSYYERTNDFYNFIDGVNDNILCLWRAEEVPNPELMPIRYYEDIISIFNNSKNDLMYLKKDVMNEFEKFKKSIEEKHDELLNN